MFYGFQSNSNKHRTTLLDELRLYMFGLLTMDKVCASISAGVPMGLPNYQKPPSEIGEDRRTTLVPVRTTSTGQREAF